MPRLFPYIDLDLYELAVGVVNTIEKGSNEIKKEESRARPIEEEPEANDNNTLEYLEIEGNNDSPKLEVVEEENKQVEAINLGARTAVLSTSIEVESGEVNKCDIISSIIHVA